MAVNLRELYICRGGEAATIDNAVSEKFTRVLKLAVDVNSYTPTEASLAQEILHLPEITALWKIPNADPNVSIDALCVAQRLHFTGQNTEQDYQIWQLECDYEVPQALRTGMVGLSSSSRRREAYLLQDLDKKGVVNTLNDPFISIPPLPRFDVIYSVVCHFAVSGDTWPGVCSVNPYTYLHKVNDDMFCGKPAGTLMLADARKRLLPRVSSIPAAYEQNLENYYYEVTWDFAYRPYLRPSEGATPIEGGWYPTRIPNAGRRYKNDQDKIEVVRDDNGVAHGGVVALDIDGHRLDLTANPPNDPYYCQFRFVDLIDFAGAFGAYVTSLGDD